MLTEIANREVAGSKLVLDERALAHLAEHRTGAQGGCVTCFVKASAVSLAYLVIGQSSLVDRSIRSLHAAVTRQQWSSHLLVERRVHEPNEVPSGTLLAQAVAVSSVERGENLRGQR